MLYNYVVLFSVNRVGLYRKTLVSNLKMHGPVSQNEVFNSDDASSPEKSGFQISVKPVNGIIYEIML